MTKAGWLKCQWYGLSPPLDDSPLLGKSRTNMGDLNLLTQTGLKLICDGGAGIAASSLYIVT